MPRNEGAKKRDRKFGIFLKWSLIGTDQFVVYVIVNMSHILLPWKDIWKLNIPIDFIMSRITFKLFQEFT